MWQDLASAEPCILTDRGPLSSASSSASPAAVRRGLIGIVCARLAVNGGIRVVYPFLPIIAHGLGVSLQVVAMFVATRSIVGLAGPAIARIVTPHRRRALMLGSQLMVITGCVLIATSSSAPAVVRTALVGMGFVATGVARPLFDLPVQTWISAHVPTSVRGRALGVTELGWSLSLAATVPIAGVMIDRLGWRSPFVLVAAMAAAGALTLLFTVSRDLPDAPRRTALPSPAHQMRATTRRIPTSLALCAGAGLAVAAGELLLVVYGWWLTQDFGLSVSQIGASTLLIVAAELIGEGLVIGVADRLGLCRTLFTALLVSATTYIALGLIGGSVGLAFAAISTLFIAFEITVVVLLAFASTITRRLREQTRLLGALMAAVACGNAAGAAVAPLVFAHGGIALSGAVSAGAATTAATVLWLGSRPHPRRARRSAHPHTA